MKKRIIKRKIKDSGHIVHLWSPFNLKIDKNYSFIPKNKIIIAIAFLLRKFGLIFFGIFNPFLFGVRVKGAENLEKVDSGAISICNHVHILDCTMVAHAQKRKMVYFTTIQSNFEVPFIRHLVRLLGGIPIPNEKGEVREAFNQSLRKLLQGNNIVHFYPEGILHPFYDGVREFRRGAFVFAYDSNVPIIPMIITFREIKGFRRFFRRKPLINLTIFEPVYPNTSNEKSYEVHRLRDLCHEKMTRQHLKSDIEQLSYK